LPIAANVKILHVDMFDSVALKQSVFDIQPNAIIHCAATGVRPSRIR
jgi:dTDP-4-dehydrorhamnose reductase